MNWKTDAFKAVEMANVMPDDYRPTYRVPVIRRWWEIWKIGRFETIEGLSNADCRRMQIDLARHLKSENRPRMEIYHD